MRRRSIGRRDGGRVDRVVRGDGLVAVLREVHARDGVRRPRRRRRARDAVDVPTLDVGAAGARAAACARVAVRLDAVVVEEVAVAVVGDHDALAVGADVHAGRRGRRAGHGRARRVAGCRRRRRVDGWARRRARARGQLRWAGRRARPVRVGAEQAAERGRERRAVVGVSWVVEGVKAQAHRTVAAERRAVERDELVGLHARAQAAAVVADGADDRRGEQLPLVASPAIVHARARVGGGEPRAQLRGHAVGLGARCGECLALGRGRVSLQRLRRRTDLHGRIGGLLGYLVAQRPAQIGWSCAHKVRG